MNSFRFVARYSREFLRHWGSYVLLILTTNLVLEYAVIPLFQFTASFILQKGDIPYVSNTNFLTILTQHPGVSLALLCLLLLILAVIFLQFTFQLFGIRSIQANENQNLWQLFKRSLRQMRHLRPAVFLFFLFYFMIVLPFANSVFRTPLLNKVTIPTFIVDFLLAKPWSAVLLALGYLAISYVGMRWLFVLPLMIFKELRPRLAIRESWQLTHERFWHYLWRLVLISVSLSIISMVGYEMIYLFQTLLDQLPKPLPAIGAMLNLTGVQLFGQFLFMWATVLYFSILLQKFFALPLKVPETRAKRKINLLIRIAAGIFVVFLSLSTLASNALYLAGITETQPLVISHRGVDEENGVQNTLPALAATIKKKPDYVEMDVHETKDHQFVVMHDENLKQLTGVDRAPYQLTLAELTQLTARENGHAAKVASFDDYLAYANEHGQKLLIELKTTPHDSSEMLDRFIARYQVNILRHQHRVHSLDYNVVKELKSRAPKLYVSYILPYNLTFPQTTANGYTMEESTLNEDFMDQARLQQKQVYAWTVNDALAMDRMIFLHVDGIITDDITLLKSEIADFQRDPTFAQRIRIYIDRIPSFDQKRDEN